MIDYARQKIDLPVTHETLLELLLCALPCVEEEEQFNSTYGKHLSKNIRAVLKTEGVINE